MELQRTGSAGVIKKAVLLLACGIITTTALQAQDARVSLSSKSITIQQAVNEIEAQTGYVIGFRSNDVNESKRVTLARTQGTTKEILGLLLAGTGQTWEMNGKYIVVVPAPQPRVAAPKPEPAPVVDNTPEKVQPVLTPVVVERVVVTPVPEPDKAPRGGYQSASRLTGLPLIALKTNLLADATATISIGAEIRTGHSFTLDLPVTYNIWDFKDNRKWRNFTFKPEMRWWTCEAFNGHFFGLNAFYAEYNVNNLPKPFSDKMREYRYDGWLAGAGISYGYQWIVGKRWSLEATISGGWAHLDYDKYPPQKDAAGHPGKSLGNFTQNYWGLTGVGFSLIYFIK